MKSSALVLPTPLHFLINRSLQQCKYSIYCRIEAVCTLSFQPLIHWAWELSEDLFASKKCKFKRKIAFFPLKKVVLIHFSIWKWDLNCSFPLLHKAASSTFTLCWHTHTSFKCGTNVSIRKKKSFEDLQLKRYLVFCKVLSVCNGEIIFQACVCDLLVFVARLELEITSAEPQLCISNAASVSPKVGTFKMMAQSLKSQMLQKRKTHYFCKNLDRTLGQMAVGERWKAVPCANKIRSIQFTLAVEHIALNFITQCYRIKSMWLDVCVAAAVCT